MGMNKKDAAAYLGISTRQLENYARQGRLSVRKERGRTGNIAIYDEEDLRPKMLLTPDEVMRLSETEAIVRIGSEYPMKLRKGFAQKVSHTPKLLECSKACPMRRHFFDFFVQKLSCIINIIGLADDNELNLIKADCITRPVIKLGYSRRLVCCETMCEISMLSRSGRVSWAESTDVLPLLIE